MATVLAVDVDASDADDVLCYSECLNVAALVARHAARCTRSRMYVLSVPGGRWRYVSRTRFPRVVRLRELADADQIQVDLALGEDGERLDESVLALPCCT